MIRPSYFKYHNVWKSCKKSHFAIFFEFSRHKTNKSPFLARVKGQISSMKQTSIILNAHELTKKAFFLICIQPWHCMRCDALLYSMLKYRVFQQVLDHFEDLIGPFLDNISIPLKDHFGTVFGPLMDHFGPFLNQFWTVLWPFLDHFRKHF